MAKKARSKSKKTGSKAKKTPKKSPAKALPKVVRIVKFVQWLEKQGLTDEFLARPGMKRAFLTLDDPSLRVLKKFWDEKKLTNPLTGAAATQGGGDEDDPCPDGFECLD